MFTPSALSTTLGWTSKLAHPIRVSEKLRADIPLLFSMLVIFVTLEMSQLPRFWSNAVAPLNIPVILVTLEVSQSPMSPLKEAAPTNMYDISVNWERSGLSLALRTMFEQGEKVPFMLSHWLLPHCSTESSLVGLVSPGKTPNLILGNCPLMATVWLPVAA